MTNYEPAPNNAAKKNDATPASPYDETAQLATAKKGNRDRAIRVAVCVVAALVIAFCAWAMSAYAQGKDPFGKGFLSSDALQTTADNDSTTNPASTTYDTQQTTVTKDDVVAAIGQLTFDGQDVSVPADDVRVVLKEGSGIWVEQVSTDDASTMVTKTAQRESTLCSWVRDNQVNAQMVTWIVEDQHGYVRMVICADPQMMAWSGVVSELLPSASSYAISYTDYQALGSSPEVAQSQGSVPTAPDGSSVQIATTEEAQKKQDEQVQSGSSSQGSSSSSSTSSDGSGASDSSSPSSGTSGNGAATSSSSSGAQSSGSAAKESVVTITVDGSAAGGSSYTRTVGWKQGMTAYDALVASGASVNAHGSIYGTYVAGIDGLAEKEHGGQSGWVYAVNGNEPNTAASNYTLNAGDVVTWSYVNVEY